ncbi:hypothetical protein QYE76_063678 [Lolium multiflorum]|uniref:Uncharacterized protein n=1 Tax=Lolium multiflorum TaxID=4521 RepID=A0AAD8W789_LOLMU|nr:hypothetical protein QYE76_063678 [Lolium multiflorum]
MDQPGQQEGAGNGGSPSWVQYVKLKIEKEAKGVSLSSLSSNLQSSDPKRPSIFMPRRQVAVAVPTVAQTPPLDRTGATATATSRWSTGGNPIVAAVGPYHQPARESREPSLITHAKKCAIVEFLAKQDFALDKGAFLKWAWEKYADASEYYEASSITMGPEELAEMLLLDGCFVLFAVFVLRKPSVPPYPLCLAEDISLSNCTMTRGKTELAQDFINLSADISQHMKQTRLDLLLLGNQIPFFVLTDLHTRLKQTFFKGIELEFQDLALSCFEEIRPSPNANTNPSRKFPDPIHHLLHLFHWSRVPRDKHFIDPCAPLRGEPEANLPCATWFKDSRIKLKLSKQQAAPGTLQMAFQRNLLGARGVLRVPALHIHNYSDLIFHNLIAFEQGHVNCGLAVTTYCICMARLLQSEADARLLRNKGILAHTHETDQEIVDLFRGIADEHRHASYSNDLLQLCKDVDEHHHSTTAIRAAKWFVLQCFPRQTITFFVLLGALISIATLINTIVSVYRFYHSYKQETR